MEKFAELVGAKSGGRIKVDLFPGGVLGSDQANVSALQGGTLDLVRSHGVEVRCYNPPSLGNPLGWISRRSGYPWSRRPHRRAGR